MEDKIKINFFKRIWYSIAKTSKYEDLRKLGVGKAINYFFTFICILALILAIIAAFIQISIINDALSYLDENLPDFIYKDNKIILENDDATILDDEKIISYLGNKLIINPLIEKNEAINQYKDLVTEKNNVLVFLDGEYILISNKYNPENNNEDGIENKKYSEVLPKYIKDTSYEYSKKDLIEYLKGRTTYTFYIAEYFVIYFGTITFIYALIIFFISLFLWIEAKASKYLKETKNILGISFLLIALLITGMYLKYLVFYSSVYIILIYIGLLLCRNEWKFKESIMNTIYSSTFSIFVYVAYMIVSYFTKFKVPFIDIICILIIFIYLFLIILKQKKEKILE